jgi:hypothetical protein
MVFAKVDVDGKTDDEVKAELQKLLVKKSAKKMAEMRAEIILHVERDQLAHMIQPLLQISHLTMSSTAYSIKMFGKAAAPVMRWCAQH